MIFCESFIPHRCQPEQDQKFDRRDVYLITQNALADGTYLDYFRAQYNRSQQIDPPFFQRIFQICPGHTIWVRTISTRSTAIANAVLSCARRAVHKLGANVEARRRAEGVYPPKEIYIPSPEDSQHCFQDYTEDVARRQQLGQLKPGEDVQHRTTAACRFPARWR